MKNVKFNKLIPEMYLQTEKQAFYLLRKWTPLNIKSGSISRNSVHKITYSNSYKTRNLTRVIILMCMDK